jgi:glycerophosphoryl diester phosphodiesterase
MPATSWKSTPADFPEIYSIVVFTFFINIRDELLLFHMGKYVKNALRANQFLGVLNHPMLHIRFSKTILFCGLFSFMMMTFIMQTEANAPKRVLNIGHRGAAALAPENTLASIRAAAKAGADATEIDVRKSSDGRLIIIHDSKLKRTTNGGDVAVAATTFDKMRSLDAGKWWKDGRYAGEKLPTLRECLREMVKCKVTPVIEIKISNIEKAVYEVIKQEKLEKKAWVISFKYSVIDNFRKLAPEVQTAWLVGKNNFEEQGREKVVQAAVDAGCKALNTNYKYFDANLLRDCRKANLAIYVWTVDDAKLMNKLIRMGVDGITTNRPGLLKVALREQKKEQSAK